MLYADGGRTQQDGEGEEEKHQDKGCTRGGLAFAGSTEQSFNSRAAGR